MTYYRSGNKELKDPTLRARYGTISSTIIEVQLEATAYQTCVFTQQCASCRYVCVCGVVGRERSGVLEDEVHCKGRTRSAQGLGYGNGRAKHSMSLACACARDGRLGSLADSDGILGNPSSSQRPLMGAAAQRRFAVFARRRSVPMHDPVAGVKYHKDVA